MDTLIGKEVTVRTSTHGVRKAVIVGNEGGQGMVLLYRLRFEDSAIEKTYADTNFRLA